MKIYFLLRKLTGWTCGIWKNDKPSGRHIRYYENWQIEFDEYYKAWLLDWRKNEYYENWQVHIKWKFKDGKEDWERIYYHRNGEIERKYVYKNGKLIESNYY
jgi:antitoxin component YwqK of YwqJK toxin-antitoxin module